MIARTLGRVDRWLAPTEQASTGLLLLLAIVAIVIAIAGTPTAKAAVAAWMILP